MATKENPGKYDCLTNLKPDEPYFVLRAQDLLADQRVRDWANEAAFYLGNDHPKVIEARACANAMMVYPARKTPD